LYLFKDFVKMMCSDSEPELDEIEEFENSSSV